MKVEIDWPIMNHEKAVEILKIWLSERGIVFEDLEEKFKDNNLKRPDLLLTEYDILLEVKTLQSNFEEKEKNDLILSKLQQREIISGYIDNNEKRLSEHLSNCRKKFREFPDKKTAVVIFNFRQNLFSEFNIVELLQGDEYLTLTKFSDSSTGVFAHGYKNRLGKESEVKEIGAILVHSRSNGFDIYHLNSADLHRRIPEDLFSTSNDRQFVYFDDGINPKINEIK